MGAGRGAPVRSPSIFHLPYKRPVSHASPGESDGDGMKGEPLGHQSILRSMIPCCVDVQCQRAVLGRRR